VCGPKIHKIWCAFANQEEIWIWIKFRLGSQVGRWYGRSTMQTNYGN